ncbi:hypothetical protein QYE76_029185 [Lolium multiflorum]|uniref:CCHC-type domain-containing protein n=1 Tax=Lolium multiflorum TaxID=4521 RepID=A0AAD8QN62_LOLMU|nr:hypothetical protein QYE76_029185 [Lolium multiflorum]
MVYQQPRRDFNFVGHGNFSCRCSLYKLAKTPSDVAGDGDVDRLSTDLSAKDLEKLVRKISSLSKKDTVRTSCGVTPYSATNALPRGHVTASPHPPLPEGGEVKERAIFTDDNQGTSRPESENTGSRKSAASSEKDVETEATASTPSPPPAASPKNKRKRDEVVDSGTSKADAARAGEPAPGAGKRAIDLYEAALVSSGDEEEDAPIDATARTRRTNQEYELESPEGDQLLDALSLLEIHGDEARDGLAEAKIGLSRLFPYFFKKKEEPATFVALAKCFTSQEKLGLQLRQEGLKVGVEDMGQIVPKCLAKMAKRKRNFGKYDDIVTPVAEDMMDELLRMDAEFFVKGSYAEHSTRAVEIQKEHQVLMVNKTTNFKKQGKPKKGNFKKGGKKAAAPPKKPKGGPKPDTDCYYCNGKGHWKRNCPKYLADLKSGLVKKKKKERAAPRRRVVSVPDMRARVLQTREAAPPRRRPGRRNGAARDVEVAEACAGEVAGAESRGGGRRASSPAGSRRASVGRRGAESPGRGARQAEVAGARSSPGAGGGRRGAELAGRSSPGAELAARRSPSIVWGIIRV